MKNIMQFINSKLFLILIILVLAGGLVFQRSSIQNLKIDNKLKDQNIAALNDTIRKEKTKNGNLQFSINSYISDVKNLKELNKGLYDIIKSQSGTIVSLTSSVIRLKQDSLTLKKYLDENAKIIEDLKQIDSNTFEAKWTLPYEYGNNNFDTFKGSTYIKVLNKSPLLLKHIDTKLTERITQINLIWGQKVENDKLRIFVESSYPGFSVESLEGVLIDPNDNKYIKSLIKQRKWFNGLHVGAGVSLGYDILDKKPTVIIGPSVIYSIYKL